MIAKDIIRNRYSEKCLFGMPFIRKNDIGDKREIEGFVSMELSKRDFDICPPSAFNIKQYMTNPQVWYNHDHWLDKSGNPINIGRTLELYEAKLDIIDSDNPSDSYVVLDIEKNLPVGYVSNERAEALGLKQGDVGLWAKIRIDVDEVWEEIVKGRLNAFSWQGKAEISEVWDSDKGRFVRMCEAVDLFEISVVTVPANEKAIFQIVKSFVGALAEKPTEKQRESVKKVLINVTGDFSITDMVEGHYHVVQAEVVNGMIVGKTVLTSGHTEDHLHAVNALLDNPVTNKSNVGEHFHKFNNIVYKNLAIQKGLNMSIPVRKFVIDFMDLPVATEATLWKFSNEDIEKLLGDNNNIDRLLSAFIWVNEDVEPYKFIEEVGYRLNPEAVQLPIGKLIDGKVTAIWLGVASAMAKIFGANGGIEFATYDFKEAYNHLSKYFKKFGKVPPKMKNYDYTGFSDFLKSTGIEKEEDLHSVLGEVNLWRSKTMDFDTITRKAMISIKKPEI